MRKNLLQCLIPNADSIRQHKQMRYFSAYLADPNLFRMNRRSVSGAFASGLFWAMIPMPMQMIAATITAIFLRINLPISVGLVWISNPITMPPIFYFNYLVGTWVLGEPPNIGEFEMSVEWISQQLSAIWGALYFGSLVVGILVGLIGYTGYRLYYRYKVIQRLNIRLAERTKR